MQFVIKVISVEGPTAVKTAKGQYNFLEINYKRDGKVEGKKIMDFVNKNVYNIVKNVKAGETLTIESAKDSKDYWQWTDVKTGGTVEENTTVTNDTPSAAPARGTRITGSTYETPEERKIKQRNITRQFAVNAALKFLEINDAATLDAVFSTAQEIEAWVYREDPVQEIVDMDNDIPV